ncbi:hypothetical protein D6D54_01395 [Spiroplasma poulsonii]|uniref:DDE Tnp4 domain-containing protein n=1 Tax=Spiroplasma poulsonii TaxID=2138 RepID=A0A433ETY1_9MOLU|nr:hypothetical protein D6D54_01395 [Spiroplasma poulsonii]
MSATFKISNILLKVDFFIPVNLNHSLSLRVLNLLLFIFLCPNNYIFYNNILIKKGIARSLFKESKIPILKNTKLIVDSGYQGIQKNHNNVLIPTKKTKKNPLNKEQKQYNRLVSKMRIIIENIFAILKKFKIITEKYRNRRKRFGLRFNLIASIYNLQLLYLT